MSPAELTSVPVSLVDGTILVFPAGVAQLLPDCPLEKSLEIVNFNELPGLLLFKLNTVSAYLI